jgi:hypothetical protein
LTLTIALALISFKKGDSMPKYRLIGGGGRRSFVSLENKIKAIADIYAKGRPAKEVLGPYYSAAEKEVPKNTSIVLSNWRKTIQDKLDQEDEFVIGLCKTYGIIEEGAPPEPVRRGASRKR